MINRIVSYLAQGFAQSKVAEMVGCTQQYVSEVSLREDFAALIQAEKTRLASAARDEQQEKRYNDLEDRVISQIKETLPFAEFRDLSRTMEVLIKRKQQQSNHSGGITVNGNAQINTVILSIPQAAAPDITLNSQKEVIAIGAKTLAPMQASQVRALFDDIERKRLSAHALPIEEAQVILPNEVPGDF